MKLPSGITPLPGIDAGQLLAVVAEHQNELINLRGGPGDYRQRTVAYQKWSNAAATDLGRVMDSDSVERLVLTARHWVLQQWEHRVVSGDVVALVEAESLDRKRHFDLLGAQLEALQARRKTLEEALLAPDTNFYLHHEVLFNRVEWREAAGGADSVCVLVPWTVLRELDRHKRAAKNVTVSATNTTPVRDRASYTLHLLRGMFPAGLDVAGPSSLASGVRLEIVLDDHTRPRLADPDAEIIDRLLVAQTLLGRDIALVTKDQSMDFAARADGLHTVNMLEPQSEPKSELRA